MRIRIEIKRIVFCGSAKENITKSTFDFFQGLLLVFEKN